MVTLDLGDSLEIEEGDGAAGLDIVTAWPAEGVATDGVRARAADRQPRGAGPGRHRSVRPGPAGQADPAGGRAGRWIGRRRRRAAVGRVRRRGRGRRTRCRRAVLRGRRAGRVSGVGERVDPLPFEDRRFVLLLPPFGVDTAAVYRAWDALADPEPAAPATGGTTWKRPPSPSSPDSGPGGRSLRTRRAARPDWPGAGRPGSSRSPPTRWIPGSGPG